MFVICINKHSFEIMKKKQNYFFAIPITPLDFFLWGYVKDMVYADAPQSIQELKEKIRSVIDKIEPQMCKNVMGNFMKRAWSCKRSHGGHMNDIVSNLQLLNEIKIK